VKTREHPGACRAPVDRRWLGFDIGAEGQMSGTRGLGPTAKLTLGSSGVAVRLTGGAAFGDETRFTGAAELVLDVMDLGDTL
jgi:hypothetical protein